MSFFLERNYCKLQKKKKRRHLAPKESCFRTFGFAGFTLYLHSDVWAGTGHIYCHSFIAPFSGGRRIYDSCILDDIIRSNSAGDCRIGAAKQHKTILAKKQHPTFLWVYNYRYAPFYVESSALGIFFYVWNPPDERISQSKVAMIRNVARENRPLIRLVLLCEGAILLVFASL